MDFKWWDEGDRTSLILLGFYRGACNLYQYLYQHEWVPHSCPGHRFCNIFLSEPDICRFIDFAEFTQIASALAVILAHLIGMHGKSRPNTCRWLFSCTGGVLDRGRWSRREPSLESGCSQIHSVLPLDDGRRCPLRCGSQKEPRKTYEGVVSYPKQCSWARAYFFVTFFLESPKKSKKMPKLLLVFCQKKFRDQKNQKLAHIA